LKNTNYQNILTTKMERQRTVLKRYPGILTDWSGNFLDKRILNHIKVGNVVRVSFVDAVKREQNNTVYFEIIRKCKKKSKLVCWCL
jgi:hypothetical protein